MFECIKRKPESHKMDRQYNGQKKNKRQKLNDDRPKATQKSND